MLFISIKTIIIHKQKPDVLHTVCEPLLQVGSRDDVIYKLF